MAQSLSKVHVHVIFSTKNREGFLVDESIRNEMRAYLATILKEYDCPASLVGGMGDHILFGNMLPIGRNIIRG